MLHKNRPAAYQKLPGITDRQSRKPTRYLVIPFLFSLSLFGRASAQTAGRSFSARNTLYAGFANRGAIYSIDYDRILGSTRNVKTSLSVGASLVNDAFALPLGIHFFNGDGDGHLEASLFIVPYLDRFSKLFSPGNLSDKQLFIIPTAGYRYQKPGGGFFFRVAIGPIIFLDPPSSGFWKMNGKLFGGGVAGAGYSF